MECHYHYILIFLIHSHHWLVLPPWINVPTGTLGTGLDRTVLGLTWLEILVGKTCLHSVQMP